MAVVWCSGSCSCCSCNCLSVCLSIYLSVCLSACQSTCKLENAAILRHFRNFWTWQHPKRSNSARLPQFWTLTPPKKKHFCETSSISELDNIKKGAILRVKYGKLSAELTASCQCVLRFFHCICLKYCACHEKVRPGHTKCCTCNAKSS